MNRKPITSEEISEIKEHTFFDNIRVERIGNHVFAVVGFYYGEAEEKMVGYDSEVAKWLNGYFGLSS